ncbi:MAG: hypothetical protein E6447_10300, partial [Bradyrhizobium sp.]|nr:hypothetical protein [Bradyrhizobium sp.]
VHVRKWLFVGEHHARCSPSTATASPAPRLVTIAMRPSRRAGMPPDNHEFGNGEIGLVFAEVLDRANQLETTLEIGVHAHGLSARGGAGPRLRVAQASQGTHARSAG